MSKENKHLYTLKIDQTTGTIDEEMWSDEYNKVNYSDENFTLDFELREDDTYCMEIFSAKDNLVLPTHFLGKPIVEIAFSVEGKCENVKTILIPEGVKAICGQSFAFFCSLESLEIPDSVEKIYSCAFEGCEKLKYIKLPKNIKFIAGGLFHSCRSLETIEIPSRVCIIEDEAFRGCENLKSLFIPKSVEKIGEDVFFITPSLERIDVDFENNYFKSIDGNLYTKDGKVLIRYCPKRTDKEFIIPNGVEIIEYNAFQDAKNLKKITLCDSLKTVKESAFAYCENLEEIYISQNTQFSSFAFRNCKKLKKFNVDLNNPYYTCVDDNLYSKDGKTLIYYALGKDVLEYSIPKGTTKIAEGAFCGSKLKKIVLCEDIKKLDTGAICVCDDLEEIVLCENLEEIDNCAICVKNLKSIIIPKNVKLIDDYAFTGCDLLKNITVDENNLYYKEVDGVLYTKDGKTRVHYPEGKFMDLE